MVIEGKVALVTGAAKRVGRAIALTLARRGADIAVHYRSSRRPAEETVAEIGGLGRKAVALGADLKKSAEVDALIDGALRSLGRLDILVNSASAYYRTPFGALTEEQWDDLIDANLKGPFLCARRCAQAMLRQGAGKIINIADWAGMRPYKDYLPYCVSKGGLITMTKALALELAPAVQVNAIAPGPVLLPEGTTAEERREIERQTPLRRIGSPEDVAAAVVFLVEGSDFITGAILPVDGGRMLA